MKERLKSPVLKLAIGERDHIKGPENAPVTLVEYGDFECNLCGRAYPVVEEILQKYGKKVRFVFRNFPLKTIHLNSYDAALVAESAALQGMFWEMHNLLYENQENLERPSLITYAESLGLDTDKIRADMESTAVLAKVKEDFRSGVISGVNGTPTFFVNGMRYNGTFYVWDLSRAIDKALEQAKQR
jgi:protein-disulfide isomerase